MVLVISRGALDDRGVWPKLSAGPLRVQVVAVGVYNASSARNPCRSVSCLHAGLQTTYPRTAVHLRLQLYQLQFISKVWLQLIAEDEVLPNI